MLKMYRISWLIKFQRTLINYYYYTFMSVHGLVYCHITLVIYSQQALIAFLFMHYNIIKFHFSTFSFYIMFLQKLN